MFRRSLPSLAVCALLLAPQAAFCGGPRWVAGSGYFDPSVKGRPVVWKNGAVSYYLDRGDLSPSTDSGQAAAMVAAAASAWNQVATAAVNLSPGGLLDEDVNGSNVFLNSDGALQMPADIQSTATGKPVAIVFDADGAVINTLLGPGASDPSDCRDNGVITLVDNLGTDATIRHALMVLNGLCAGNRGQLAVMQYQIMRGFGRILGLDWSQANEEDFASHNITSDDLAGWPIMHPVEYLCQFSSAFCSPDLSALRYDDIAALNRLYPVTAANISSFPGKVLTAPATISLQGTIHFRNGQGMQGVNVVLRPVLPGTNLPDVRYTVTTVSGAFFQGNAPNPVNGAVDTQGDPVNEYGSDDASLEGWFDLSGVPLPAGTNIADYQLSFEAINPLYAANNSVGPYQKGQVTPSGTMPVILLHGLTAGTQTVEDIVIQDSANQQYSGDDGTETAPARIPPSGEWTGRITGYGHTAWFDWPVRPYRELTVEAQALDEDGRPTLNKAQVVLGAWNGSDAPGSAPVSGTSQAFNGAQTGLTTLSVATVAPGHLRLGIADARGDGRPDYLYHARLLYADSVTPTRISLAGGPITIRGVGFRPNAVVTVNGVRAVVTGVTPTEITAIAPPANGKTGVVLLTVSDPQTLGVTAIQDGLSYDALGGDALGIVTAHYGPVGLGVWTPFTVKALAADGQTPAAGVIVTFSVTNGAAVLACGQPVCSVLSGGDGLASINVAANTLSSAQVTASLSDGASVMTEFTGSGAPVIAALTPNLYIAADASFLWAPQAEVLNNGTPVSGQQVNWSASNGAVAAMASSTSNAGGTATGQINVGPLAAGTDVPVSACLSPGPQCAAFHIYAVHSGLAQLTAVSGAGQSLSASQTPAPVVLRVTDAAGHPMAAAIVTFYETLVQWTPDCPAQGRCPSAPTLATQAVQASSGADGLVTLVPVTGNGVPTRLYVTAATGNATSLSFEIEQHP
ncbi:MAG: hypothetical protein QJR10_11930 [Bacillota bacterium]|nr:hypothetical protein [Bacillota bacterium]